MYSILSDTYGSGLASDHFGASLSFSELAGATLMFRSTDGENALFGGRSGNSDPSINFARKCLLHVLYLPVKRLLGDERAGANRCA